MTKRTRQTKNTKRTDIYEQVTEKILSQLEKGVVPWRSPHCAQVGFPGNFDSGKCYQGINVWMLAMAGYVSPWFLTYLQAQKLGGQVRKGEKGQLVVKVGSFEKKARGENTLKGEEEKIERGKYLKGYTVFNSSQIEGIEFPEVKRPEFTPSERIEKAKAIVSGMKHRPEIREGRGVKSCYWIKEDVIDLPDRSYFESEERFYQTLFHELVHSVGAESRLSRSSLTKNKGRGASERGIYEKEELVAEMGASFLMAHAGIVLENHGQNAAYVENWLRALRVKDHRKWIIEAASDAEKAVKFILGQE